MVLKWSKYAASYRITATSLNLDVERGQSITVLLLFRQVIRAGGGGGSSGTLAYVYRPFFITLALTYENGNPFCVRTSVGPIQEIGYNSVDCEVPGNQNRELSTESRRCEKQRK